MHRQSYIFEDIILQQFCLILVIFAAIATGANLLLGLEPELSVVTTALGLVSLVLWWFQKRYQLFKLSRILITILGILSINLAWYYNYDSQGPILGLFIMLSILAVFIWPLRTAVFFAIGMAINVAVLFYINYHYLSSLLVYPSASARIVDIYLGTLISVIVVSIFSYLIKWNYIKKHNQALRSERLKAAFLQNISHEIRTPLNVMLGFSELLKGDQLSVVERNTYSKTIRNSGEQLLSMMNNMVEISLLETHQVDMEECVFDLFELLDSVRANVESNPALRHELSILFPDPEEFSFRQIRSDKNKLQSVLVNLITNAIKYTDEGVVGVFLTETADKKLEFSIRDTGKGIQKEMSEMIFKPFIQVEGQNKYARNGVGLGLPVSKGYVELMGGEIWLESTVGKGSVFYFTIPFIPIKDPEIQVNLKPALEVGVSKVIIAEDDENSFLLLKIFLNKLDIIALHAKSGLEAVQVFKQNVDVDLILMDIKLPDLDGVEALNEIRKLAPQSYIVAQTAFAFDMDRAHFLKAGFNDYVAKPTSSAAIGAVLDQYTRHQYTLLNDL